MRIMRGEKTTLPSLRNIKWRTVKTETNKMNEVLSDISMNIITELNELIIAGAKLVCEKIGIPSKNTMKLSKPKWKILLDMQKKQIYENRSKWWNKGKTLEHGERQKRKGKTRKNNDTTWEDNAESTGERRKIKIIQTKQNIPKQGKKSYQKMRREDTKTY